MPGPYVVPVHGDADLPAEVDVVVVGGGIIGVVEQLSGYYLPAGFQEVTANIVLLAVLIMRPQGIFGETYRKKV